ncbi:hypothetical protein JCM11641_003166 [Rhodosporidiobolus odoratus]
MSCHDDSLDMTQIAVQLPVLSMPEASLTTIPPELQIKIISEVYDGCKPASPFDVFEQPHKEQKKKDRIQPRRNDTGFRVFWITGKDRRSPADLFSSSLVCKQLHELCEITLISFMRPSLATFRQTILPTYVNLVRSVKLRGPGQPETARHETDQLRLILESMPALDTLSIFSGYTEPWPFHSSLALTRVDLDTCVRLHRGAEILSSLPKTVTHLVLRDPGLTTSPDPLALPVLKLPALRCLAFKDLYFTPDLTPFHSCPIQHLVLPAYSHNIEPDNLSTLFSRLLPLGNSLRRFDFASTVSYRKVRDLRKARQELDKVKEWCDSNGIKAALPRLRIGYPEDDSTDEELDDPSTSSTRQRRGGRRRNRW